MPKPKAGLTRKSGLTKSELDFIAANLGDLTVAEVAAKLDRTEEVVSRAAARLKDMAENKGKPRPTPVSPALNESPRRASALGELHESPTWKQVRDQFTAPECRYYEEQYVLLLEQFGEGVVMTEKLQVNSLITYLILGQRTLAKAKETQADIKQARADLAHLLGMYPDAERREERVNVRIGRTMERIEQLEDRLASNTKEYKELDTNQQALMKQLKGTRDQRVQSLEGKTASFFDLMKELKDLNKRKAADRENELLRQATVRTMKELGKPFRYADGTVDRPLLSPDTIPAPGTPEVPDADTLN